MGVHNLIYSNEKNKMTDLTGIYLKIKNPDAEHRGMTSPIRIVRRV